MTNGEKLLEVFPNSKADTENYIWSVGLVINPDKEGQRTIIFDREFWDGDYEGQDEESEYQRGWSDALSALESEEV